MKKLFVLTLAVFAICFMFSACGADPNDPTKDGRVDNSANNYSLYDSTTDYNDNYAGNATDNYDGTSTDNYDGNATNNYTGNTTGNYYGTTTENYTGDTIGNYSGDYSQYSQYNNDVARNSYNTGRNLANNWF